MNSNFNIRQFVSSFLKFSSQTIVWKTSNNGKFDYIKPMDVQQPQVLPNQRLLDMKEIPKIQLEMLNSLDKGALVKELMNLPKDFPQLVSMFSQSTANQNPMLDISKMVAFLQENGEIGKKNLLNLIVTINKSGFTQTEQLKELSFIINACMPAPENTNATIMKNLILLYLPWLPLGEGMGFDIEVREDSKENSDIDDDSVMIYIQTLNFGTIKILLKVENKTKILIQINCDENFPKNIAEKRFKKEVETYSLQSEIEYTKTKQDDTKAIEKSAETRVNVNTSRHINPLLMLATHSIIKIIFEIDKNTIEVNSKNELTDSEEK